MRRRTDLEISQLAARGQIAKLTIQQLENGSYLCFFTTTEGHEYALTMSRGSRLRKWRNLERLLKHVESEYPGIPHIEVQPFRPGKPPD